MLNLYRLNLYRLKLYGLKLYGLNKVSPYQPAFPNFSSSSSPNYRNLQTSNPSNTAFFKSHLSAFQLTNTVLRHLRLPWSD